MSETASMGVAGSPEEKQPFLVHCGKCSHEWAAAYLPAPVDLFVRLAKAPCPMCGAKKVQVGPLQKPTADGDAVGWLTNGDTGISSRTIWRVMMNKPLKSRGIDKDWDSTPSDPSDFGRCYRLLQVMPSWRARLPEVAEKHPEWGALISAWDELTELYEQELSSGTAPRLYKRIHELNDSYREVTR